MYKITVHYIVEFSCTGNRNLSESKFNVTTVNYPNTVTHCFEVGLESKKETPFPDYY